MEEWKPVPGFEQYYVSNLGRVKSLTYRNQKKEHVLTPFRIGNYLGVWLGAGNKQYVHKLVAACFCEYKPDCEIDHMNRNKLDNRAENLRFVSKSENCKNKSSYTRNGSVFIRNGKEIKIPKHRVEHKNAL